MNLELGADLHRRINIVVCLALAVLFLYNPYLAVTPSSSVLNVHHSLSYRATVGSSESQHLSPVHARKILALSVATVLSWLDSPANPIVSRVTEVSPHPAYALRSGQPLTNWYEAVGVNINLPLFNGFMFDARAKAADLQTEANRQRLSDLRNNVARDVRNAWQDTNRAYERLSVTRQLREQANLAFDLTQSRYNL